MFFEIEVMVRVNVYFPAEDADLLRRQPLGTFLIVRLALNIGASHLA